MTNVIELSDDVEDDDTSLLGKAKPEVFTLISDDYTPKGQSQNHYPSSPREIEVIPDTSIQPTKESIEISAPFCQDLCTTVGDESSKVEDIELRPRSGKRILEDILNEESSVGYSRIEQRYSSISDAGQGNGLKRPRLEGCSPTHYDTRGDYSADGPKDLSKDRNPDASEVCADILEAFPISSPSAATSRSKGPVRGQSRQLFVQSSDRSFNPERVEENGFLSQGSVSNDERQEGLAPVTVPSAACLPLGPVASPNKITDNDVHEDEDMGGSRGTEFLELNVRNLLPDSKVSDAPYQSDDSSGLLDHEELKEAKINTTKVAADVSTRAEVARLRPYIVHGKCYSDDESQELVRNWLSNNKAAFKASNQIYRSNEKARACITVTMANGLIKILRNSGCDFETGIKPAILQASADAELPRIGFLRACDSEYDLNHDIFYPCEKFSVEESLSILYYDAQAFFELYRSDKEYLFKRFRSFTKSGKYLIVVLSNIKKLGRALEALEDRKYKARVQDELTGSQINKINGSRKKASILEDLDMKRFDVEQRLRFIDRLWGVKIHVVSSHAEFAESLPNLVSLIAKQRMDPAIRYMRYSHINARSSKDKTDVLRQTLQQINKMPELKANSVIEAYPTFQMLFSDFKRGELKSGLDGKHLMTEAMETRLYKLLTCDNPNESIQ